MNLSGTSTELGLEDLLSHCIWWVHDLGMLRTLNLESQEFCLPGCALRVGEELFGCLTPGHQLCLVSLGSVIWVPWEEREQVAEQRWEDERSFFCRGQPEVPCSAVKMSLIIQKKNPKKLHPNPPENKTDNRKIMHSFSWKDTISDL